MTNILKAGFFCLTLLFFNSASADSLTDLGEVYSTESLPGKTDAASSDFHGLLGAGLFNFQKIIGDNNRQTALLPIIILTYQDWAYWSIGGGGVWLLQSADRKLKLGVGLKVHRGYTEESDTVYAGMDTRKRSVDGSVNALWKTGIVNSSLHYYHDIGKMKKPQYFIENQAGKENKHDKLAPSMSVLIITSHVKDGVELAKEHHINKEIIDIIGQHQGTKLISYFYQRAKDQTGKGGKTVQVMEEDFRYPGPKPQTKEAGLVMLADMVEAATRSLTDHSPARVQGTVQKIINNVFADGQLDDCEITLKDLHEIAKSFNITLSGIYHDRVEYPGSNPAIGKRLSNGDTNKIPEESAGSQHPDDKEDNEEALRRLGLR